MLTRYVEDLKRPVSEVLEECLWDEKSQFFKLSPLPGSPPAPCRAQAVIRETSCSRVAEVACFFTWAFTLSQYFSKSWRASAATSAGLRKIMNPRDAGQGRSYFSARMLDTERIEMHASAPNKRFCFSFWRIGERMEGPPKFETLVLGFIDADVCN